MPDEHAGPRARSRSGAIAITVAGVAFVVAFAVRWVTFTGLGGDDHWPLWTAANYLKGDRPFRDFADAGVPLYWAMSTLVQWLVGYRAVGEMILGTLLTALGFAIAFNLAWQASRSLWVATLLSGAALLVATSMKLYSYPKMFVYPLGLWVCWRYIDKPSFWRAFALAAGVAIAWGYRHDHGAYVGVAALTAILATHWAEGSRVLMARCARAGLLLLLLIGPYLLLIQVNEGLVSYLQERLRIARQLEAAPGVSRTQLFAIDGAAPRDWLRIDPPRPARVHVDWNPEVTAAARVELERRYALEEGTPPKQRLYEYFLTDISQSTLLAIANDARIVEKRGITVSYREGPDGTKTVSDVVAEPADADDPPGARGRVALRWAANLNDTGIAALERSYGLLDPAPDRQRWEYSLADVSTSNIRAIVEEPGVSDTGLIDREAFRPMEESSLIRLQRTLAPLRISVAPRYWHPTNAAVLLYYLFYALPPIVLILLARHRFRMPPSGLPNAGAKMLVAALLLIAIDIALLRKLGYIADHGHTAAVLAAWIIGQSFAVTDKKSLARLSRVGGGTMLLLIWLFASVTYISPVNAAATAGFNEGIGGMWDKSVRSFRSLATSPPIDEYAPPGTSGDRGLLRYLYECTRPDDRIWLLTETHPLAYYTERRVVGHIFWSMGFKATPEDQRRTIASVERQEVPFVMSFGGDGPLVNLQAYNLVHDYVAKRYTRRYAIPEDKAERGLPIWILSDGRREPTGTYELFGLPCFK
jgi:hypothetical protein